jgi:hypothetical protein
VKRVVAFLVLAALGLGLLWWLGRSRAGEQPAAMDGAPPSAASDRSQEEGQPTTVRFEGAFRMRLFDESTGRAWSELVAEDTRTVGDVDQLTGFSARLFDASVPETPEEARLQAAAGRLRRQATAGPFELDFERRIELVDVVAHFTSGLPLAPLDFSAPRAVFDATAPGRRRILSPDPVVLRSPSLEARGTGLDIDLVADALVLERDAELVFSLPGGSRSTVRSSGSLAVLSSPGTIPASVEFEGTGGTELEVPGAPPSFLQSQHMRISAIADGSGGESLRLERLVAEGAVVWRSGENLFSGDRAELAFDEQGALREVVLSGSPVARLVLSGSSAEVPGRVGASLTSLRLSGAGPLQLTFGEERRYSMGGPALVEADVARLRSNGAVTGGFSVDGRRASFRATAGVVLVAEGNTLEAADLDVTLERGPGAQDRLQALAHGGARLAGRLSDGPEYSVASPARLLVEHVGGRWVMREADDVTFAIEGDAPVRARAQRVRDLDLAAASLVAEGAVELESPGAAGRGERLEVDSREHFTLAGATGAPARLESTWGSASAATFEVDGPRWVARGAVNALVSPPVDAAQADAPAPWADRYQIACDELVIAQEDAPTVPRRRFEMDARGSVRAQVTSERGTSSLAAQRLRIEHADGREPGSASESTLWAEQGVDAQLILERARGRVACERLEVNRRTTPRGPVESAEARGAVTFVLETTPAAPEGGLPALEPVQLSGEGETLVLEPTGRVELLPAPDERVRARGMLFSHALPFELLAARILLDGARLEADQPELAIAAAAGAPPAAGPNAMDLGAGIRARARRLVATRERVVFEGAAHAEGALADGQTWSIDCERATFEGRAGATSVTSELRSFAAEGAVVLRFADSLVARGDLLEARRSLGALRLTGSPARFESAVLTAESEWVEFDPELEIVTATGRGRLLRSGPAEPPGEPAWSLDYLAARTLIEPDSLVFALREPAFHSNAATVDVRASWALLWLDRRHWTELPRRLARGEITPEDLRFGAEEIGEGQHPSSPMGRLFGVFESSEISNVLREIYIEGPIEASQAGQAVARADAIYLDTVTRQGWIEGVNVHLRGRENERLFVRADWLRHMPDGSLFASRATVTPCSFEEPHVRVTTGELRIWPVIAGRRTAFAFSLRKNRIQIGDRFSLPLPPLQRIPRPGSGDESSGFGASSFLGNVHIGRRSRFGYFLRGTFFMPTGRVGDWLARVLGGDPQDHQDELSLETALLSARGALVDTAIQSTSLDAYALDLRLGFVSDSGEDRGFVRVDENDRSTLRTWLRGSLRTRLGERLPAL